MERLIVVSFNVWRNCIYLISSCLNVFPRSLANLKVVTLFDCPELTEIFSHELAEALSSLEQLKVEKCSKVVEIVKTQTSFEISEPVDLSDILHKVKIIELVNLPELQSICNSTSVNWKSLCELKIISCNKLRNLASILREGGKLPMIKCEVTWWDALLLKKEEKLHFRPRDFVLEQPLVVGTFHKGESSNHARPADPMPLDTVVLKEHHDRVMSNINSIGHAGTSEDQDHVEHVNHQPTSTNASTKDETLPLYKGGCSKVDTSISTH